ncbi:MAG: 4-hydroxy-tetrahydrodipicolinate synthase [Candidatus Sericytochromatia bacterium]
MVNFGNLMTAMVTPFDKNLNVDYDKLQELALLLVEKNKTTGIVACGTTGESPTLSKEEKISIFKSLKEVLKNKAPLIAGTGSYNTKEAIELSKHAEEVGADGLLVVNPYYNKPDQNGLYEHFKAVANAVSIPVILYNHPGRTGVSIESDTMKKLSEIKNIVAVKDSSGNLSLIEQYKLKTPSTFKIYSGDDPLNFVTSLLGGSGAVSVASHIAGLELSEMFDLIEQNKIAEARKIHYSLLDLFKVLFIAPSPAPTKYALKLAGFDTGGVRLPLTEMSEEHKNKVKTVVEPFLK